MIRQFADTNCIGLPNGRSSETCSSQLLKAVIPMDSQNTSFLKGHFLMASPSLADPNFRQSVTCISEHTADGAVGIIVNQVHEGLDGKMIFQELGMPWKRGDRPMPVHIGGPVHTNELFVLHGPPLDWDGSLIITEELALSNSHAILEALAADEGPEVFVMALGCAGWAAGQLEWELRQNAWLTIPCCPDIIFRTPVAQRWESAIRRLGIDPSLLSDTAGNA